ncbi:hypothetical protein EV421DRAFT_1931817 [Armillaria borealis]|uniref:Uncharacterized protein n=1 Tax=Armillaria borealis TaxID=47425 RepID=A0AA39MEJ4_9AGAR|nr:hypothetical protein EV421DRAFT_1931817 [Armillaria borealis]
MRGVIFSVLELNMDCLILESLLHGLYTGLVVVTLWTMFASPKRSQGTFLRTIIIMLYVLSTITFTKDWIFERRAFIEYGNNYYYVYAALVHVSPWWRADFLISSITGGISTLLVDVTIIWRCWILWDRKWRVVFIPIICTVAGMAMKIIQTLSNLLSFTYDISKSAQFAGEIDWSLIYILMTLATTVICTILILYRIVRLAHRISLFRSIISTLVESSAMYSLVLIVYLALVVKNLEIAYYADTFASYVKVIAPTLLVLRVATISNSNSSNEEQTSRDLSEICFTRMEENSCDDVSDPSSTGSHYGTVFEYLSRLSRTDKEADRRSPHAQEKLLDLWIEIPSKPGESLHRLPSPMQDSGSDYSLPFHAQFLQNPFDPKYHSPSVPRAMGEIILRFEALEPSAEQQIIDCSLWKDSPLSPDEKTSQVKLVRNIFIHKDCTILSHRLNRDCRK